MTFLSPLVLAGMAALSIPVILHLMNRFRSRTTDWAAMRFLVTTVRRSERKVRLRDLFLLFVRCLLVALLVFAFARPAIEGQAGFGGAEGGPVAAVLLLDHSASMGRASGAETNFDRARGAVREWLDAHEGRSLAALHLVSDRSTSLVSEPQDQFALIRSLVDEAEITDRSTDLLRGIRLACESLRTVSDLPREVRVYTDGQATAWGEPEELKRIAERYPGIRIVPVWIGGDEPPANLAITSLEAEGGVPAARQPCPFRIEVTNFGSEPVDGVSVSLGLAGEPPSERAAIPRLRPGGARSIRLTATFPEPGPRAVTATLSADSFAADNTRTTALNVARRVDVFLVEEDHAGPAMDREGYFLANALVPLPRDRMPLYYLNSEFLGPNGMTTALRNENRITPRAVFLCNLGALSDTATEALRDYVKTGGHLVIFPGPRTFVEDWRTNDAFWDLLPAELEEPTSPEAPAERWQGSGFTHPVTAFWNDNAQGSLGAIQFQRHFPLRLKEDRDGEDPNPAAETTVVATSDPRVINRFESDAPSVVEWSWGEGTVVLFSSTSTPEWNNFPLHPAFVPYLQRLVGYLNRGESDRLVLAPGEAFRQSLAPEWADRSFTVLGPGDAEARTAGNVVADEDGAFLRYAATEKAGAYRLRIGDDPVATFAVQIDPAESDTRPPDREAIASALTVERSEEQTSPAGLPVTRELWTLLIWLAAALFLFEAVLAHRLSQRTA